MTHALVSRRPFPGIEPVGGVWTVRWDEAILMGIVNATPDSFSDGGRHLAAADAIEHGRALIGAGAAIVDVGGESTRPGAAPVDAAEELDRVVPVIEVLSARSDALISVDTSKPEVARAAVRAGAHLINDVRGLRDPQMLETVAELGVPAVLMHMRGEPRTMQERPRYGDVVADVEAWLLARLKGALAAGVPSVAIDPGIGFGKTLAHNLALGRSVARLAGHGVPVVLGASRKRSIGTITGVAVPAERDPGSIAWHLRAAADGAAVLRVHDVAGHAQALAVWRALHG